MEQLSVYPQEKVYVQNDKPLYVAGEDVWFRIHMVNAALHVPVANSRYVYVELINPMEEVVSRLRIRPDSMLVWHGQLPLSETLPEGSYQLRFYTRYMQNLSEDYFFRRQINIGDPLTAMYVTYPTFEYSGNRKKLRLELEVCKRGTHQRIMPENVRITYGQTPDESDPFPKYPTKKAKTDNDSIARIELDIHDGKQVVMMEYDYEGKFHKQYIPLPAPDNDYVLDFFPEGGDILSGTTCRIAFKALNSNGLGEDISGCVLSEKGDTLSLVKSQHLGMGVFSHYQKAGEHCFLVCRNNAGLEKRFQLPDANPEGVSLQAQWNRDRLLVKVLAAEGNDPTGMKLLVLCRGILYYALEWASEYAMIECQDMPSGVVQLLLLDAQDKPLSERLVFNINTNESPLITAQTNLPEYGQREEIKASFKIEDIEHNPLIGNFSIAVTDDNDVSMDTCNNILSELLLRSELKGYIENPAYYFSNTATKKSTLDLDVLMMTQGWSRYNVVNALNGSYIMPEQEPERSTTITGIAKGGLTMNKGGKGFPVQLISMKNLFFLTTETDENGRFKFDRFELPDSTALVLQANTLKGGSHVELLVDETTYPDIRLTVPWLLPEKREYDPDEFFEKAEQRYTTINGMRMIYLDQVEVRAKKIVKPKSQWASAITSTIISSEEFEKYHYTSVFQILQGVAGVMILGNEISIRGGGTPLVMIDNMEIDASELNSLIVDDIDEIVVMKGADAAIFGSRGGNGAILLTTKTGDISFKPKEKFNIKTLNLLGYHISKEFYSPRYDTEEQKNNSTPDLRTTIYWNPSVATGADGLAEVSFFSADSQETTYSIVIEGLTSSGKPVYNVSKIKIKPPQAQ